MSSLFGSSDFEPDASYDDYDDFYVESTDGEDDSDIHMTSTMEFNLAETWSQTRRQANSQLSSLSEFSFGDNENISSITGNNRERFDAEIGVKSLLELSCLRAASSFTFDQMFSMKMPLSVAVWKRLLRLQFPQRIEEVKSALAIYSEGYYDDQGLVVRVLQQIGCVLYGEVTNSRGTKFKIHCLGDRGKIAKSRCSACKGGFCAHVQKVVYAYITKLNNQHIHFPISHDLNQLNKDQLLHLIGKMLSYNKYSNLLLLTKRLADECSEMISTAEAERDYSLGSTASVNGAHWYFKRQKMSKKIERNFQAQKEGHLSSFLPANMGRFRFDRYSDLEKLAESNFLSIVENWKCVDSFSLSTKQEFSSDILKLAQQGDLTCVPLIELSIDVIISLSKKSKATHNISTDAEILTVQPRLNPSDKENHALNTVLLLIISFFATQSIENPAKTEAMALFRTKLEAAFTDLDLSYRNLHCVWDGLAFMNRTIVNLHAISGSELKLDVDCNLVFGHELHQQLNLSSFVFLHRAQCEIDSVYPPLFSKIVTCLDTNLNTIQKNLKLGKIPWRDEFWSVCYIISRIPDGELKSCLLEIALMNFVGLSNPTYDDLCWLKFVLDSVSEISLAYIQSNESPGYIIFEVLAGQLSVENLIDRFNGFMQWLSSERPELDKKAFMENLTFVFNAKWLSTMTEESDVICEKQLHLFVKILSLCDANSIDQVNDIYRDFLAPHFGFDSSLISVRLSLFANVIGKMLKRSLSTRTYNEKENLSKLDSVKLGESDFEFSVDFSFVRRLQNSDIPSAKTFYDWIFEEDGPLERLTLCESLQSSSTVQFSSRFSKNEGVEDVIIIAVAQDLLKSVVPFRNNERSKWTFDEFFACPFVEGQLAVLRYIKGHFELIQEEARSLFALKVAKILTALLKRDKLLANNAIEIIQKYVDGLQDVPANTGTSDSSHNIVNVLANVVEFQLQGAKKENLWSRRLEIARLDEQCAWQFFTKAAESKKKALSIAFRVVIRRLMEHEEFAEDVEMIKRQTTDESDVENLFVEQNTVLNCFSQIFIRTNDKTKFKQEDLRNWLDY